MRGPITRLLAVALAGLLTAPATAPDARGGDGELTVVSWGGAYTKSQILGFIRPFESRTGIEVDVLDYDGGLGEIRGQVESFNVKWDVVDLELADAIRGCREGLLVEVDPDRLPPSPDGIPAREDFIEEALQGCAVGSVVWSTVVAFDRAAFKEGEAPKGLEDLFDIGEFPGRRGLRRTPKGNLEWALVADGVAPEKVYRVLDTEKGLDRAFRVLSRIKPYVVWWTTGTEAVRMLSRGQIRMAAAYSGRVWEANASRGADLGILWDHQLRNLDLWGIVRHTENLSQARRFLRFATSTESLARQAGYIPYGPARRSSQALVPAGMKPYLPTIPDHMAGSVQIDAAWWAENFERIDRRFQRWLERPVRVPRALPH